MTHLSQNGIEAFCATRGKTGEQLSLEMADALLNVFGSAKPSEDDRRELADYLVMKGLRWANERYEIGLRG